MLMTASAHTLTTAYRLQLCDSLPANTVLSSVQEWPCVAVCLAASVACVLQAGPRLTSLSVDSLALPSHTHVNTPWPWREFSIQNLDDLSQLLKLPNPAGEGSSRDVKCDCLTVKENVNTVRHHTVRHHTVHCACRTAPCASLRTCIKHPARQS